MIALLIKIFGPHYLVRLTAILEVVSMALAGLAIAPYELGSDAVMIPPEWKPVMLRIAAGCFVVFRILNALSTKAANVSGTSAEGQTVTSRGVFVASIPPKSTEPAKE